MPSYVPRAGLRVDAALSEFIETSVLAGTGVAPQAFWQGYAGLLADFAPENHSLLQRRAVLQAQIDAWLCARRGQAHDPVAWREFLAEIGYLVPEGQDFTITTGPVDPEIATLAGPQLVVPLSNARFALNAANARWGSLYDALYSSDALGAKPDTAALDADRAAEVVAWSAGFLDKAVPLRGGSHLGARAYKIEGTALSVHTADGRVVALENPAQFIGTGQQGGAPPDPVAEPRVAYHPRL